MNKPTLQFIQGLTLIETILYTALLSILVGGFISYASTIQENNLEMLHDINDAYESF